MTTSMRRSLVALVVAVAVVATLPAAASGQDVPDPSTLPSGVLRDLATGRARSLDGQSLADGSVTVEVLHELDDAAAAAAVVAVGGRVNGAVPGHLVQAEVPIAQLASLQATPGVTFVRPPVQVAEPGEATTGVSGARAVDPVIPVEGAQVTKTNADEWHAAGWTGQGVEIGIIDNFERGAWDEAVAAGEIPEASSTFCRVFGSPCDLWNLGLFSDDHGVAVAEIIHEMAPDARIHIAVVYSAADLQAAVDHFEAQGVTVVNRSQTAEYDGPGDGTGPTAAIIDDAVAGGMVWANAAGNNSGSVGDSGDYYRSGWRDADGDDYLEFSGTDEVMRVRCAFANGLRWSDWDDADPTDYDIEVYRDEALTDLVGTGDDDQTAGAPPLELLNLRLIGRCALGSENVYVRVKLVDAGAGTEGDVLELMANQSRFEYWQNPYGASGPMVDSANPGLLAVGAIDPAGGTTIASYSSWGPTNDGRLKPDLSAASCVRTLTTGPGCFNGTSAASPATAGAAALVMSSGLHTDPGAVGDYLRGIATDRGDPGPDMVYGTGELVLPAPPSPPAAAGEVHLVTPTRVLDTRKALGAPEVAPLGPRGTLELDVTGVGGVPESGVDAVVLTLTGVATGADTHLTTWPAGDDRPTASSLNLAAGETAANLIVVGVGEGGAVSVFNNAGDVHVVADVVGWIDDGSVEGGEVAPVAPSRLLDTRSGVGTLPGRLGPGASLDLAVTGRGGVPADGVDGVWLNLSAVAPSADTHLTVHATGDPLPPTSNLNVAAGDTRAALVLVPVGAGGAVRLTNRSGSVDLVADVVGWVGGTTEAGELVVQSPLRVIDTRRDLGPIVSAASGQGTPVRSSTWSVYDLTPGAGLPADGATAALVNLTVTGAAGPGHVALVPGSDFARPATSNLNLGAGQTRANAVLVPLDESGLLTVYTEVAANGFGPEVIVDVVGWVA